MLLNFPSKLIDADCSSQAVAAGHSFNFFFQRVVRALLHAVRALLHADVRALLHADNPLEKKVEFLAALWVSAVNIGRRLKENLLLGFWLKRFGATLDFAFWISFDL